jgi:hypothetical protein
MDTTTTKTVTATASKMSNAFCYKNRPSRLPSSSSLLSSTWEWYKDMVGNHQSKLDILDESLSKLLFWLPHTGSDDIGNEGEQLKQDGVDNSFYQHESGDAAWREVGYGILSLHRLSMHLALDETETETETETRNETQNTNETANATGGGTSSSGVRKNHYGTSIRTKDTPTIAATSVRICLTVLHSVMPALISLAMLRARTNERNHKNNRNYCPNNKRISALETTSRVRLLLEQAKFLLRLSLLVPYWRQQRHQQRQDCFTTMDCDESDFGIMLNGGLYYSDQPQESIGIPWQHASALQKRRNYVGERTGWKAHNHNNNTNTTANANTNPTTATKKNGIYGCCSDITKRLVGDNKPSTNTSNNVKTAIVDLLYAFRPLLWAWLESKHHASKSIRSSSRGHLSQGQSQVLEATSPYHARDRHGDGNRSHPNNLFKGWLLCLFMDVLSIRLLEQTIRHNSGSSKRQYQNNPNPFANAEVKRRKLRLLLYALRSPVWSNHTLPVLEGVSNHFLRNIPVLGNIVETVLWDWVLYYQHPFVSEKG